MESRRKRKPKKTIPGSSAHDRELKEQNAQALGEKVAVAIGAFKAARDRIAVAVDGRLNESAKEALWGNLENRIEHKAAVLLETDPLPIQLFKRVLLSMEGAERALIIFQDMNNRRVGLMPVLGDNLMALVELTKIIYNLVKELGELEKLARQLNIEAALEPMRELLNSLKNAAINAAAPESKSSRHDDLLGNPTTIAEAVGGIVAGYFNTRVATPRTPEAKYSPRTTPEVKYSLQENREWFQVLIEPARSATSKLHQLVEILSNHITKEEAKTSGQKLAPADLKKIEELKKALDGAEFDKKGYFKYTKDETPLSQSLKALFNVIWSINELALSDNYNLKIKHGLKAKDHFVKILWPEMGPELRVIFERLMDSMLGHAKEIFEPALVNFSKSTHELEMQSGFRYGALLQDVRPLFEAIESIYIERGIPISNPLGAAPEERKEFEEKAVVLQKQAAEVMMQSDKVSRLNQLLKTYEELGVFMSAGEKKLGAKVAAQVAIRQLPMPSILTLPSYIGFGVGEVLTTFMNEMVYQPGLKLADAVAQGLLSSAEAINRANVAFPRGELLLAIAEANAAGALEGADIPDIKPIQERLIAEMSLEEKRKFLTEILAKNPKGALSPVFRELKKALLKALEPEERERKRQEEEEKNAYRITRFARGVGRAATGQASRIWQGGSPKNLRELVAAIQKKNKALVQQRYDLSSYTEGLQGYSKVRLEYAMHQLEEHGLTYLIRATHAAMDDKTDKNLPQMRRLAAILADFDEADRASYLTASSARAKAQEFVKPENLLLFINKLKASKDPEKLALAHSLAVEVALGGFVPVNESMIESIAPTSEAVARTDLIHVLDRFEASDVVKMMTGAIAGNPEAQLRFAFLTDLIKQFSEEDSFSLGLSITTKEDFARLLIDQYKKLKHVTPPDETLLNKLGLFLGRLASFDKEIAIAIFREDAPIANARKIVYDECVEVKASGPVRPDAALFYESLVNALTLSIFSDAESVAGQKIRFETYLQTNLRIIGEMHRILHPHDKDPNNSEEPINTQQIEEIYKKDAWGLCKLIEKFTEKTSPNSTAREKLRALFSGVALSLGEEGEKVRKAMLEHQAHVLGSVQTPYMQLLTVPASYAFWKQINVDLVLKPQEKLNQKIDDLMAPLLKDEFLKEDARAYVNEQKAALEKLAGKLVNGTKEDVLITSRFVAKEMNAIEQAVQAKADEWNIATKNLSNQALDDGVNKIVGILKTYVKDRKGLAASAESFLGFNTRKNKIDWVEDWIKKYEAAKATFKLAPHSPTEYAEKIVSLGEQLNGEYRAMIVAGDWKSGKLGRGVAQIQKLDKPQLASASILVRKSDRAPAVKAKNDKDDLSSRVFSIRIILTKIVNAIKKLKSAKRPEKYPISVPAAPDPSSPRGTRKGG